MASLHDIRDLFPALLIDAASSVVQVGLLQTRGTTWETSTDEAGVAVFQCIEKLHCDLGAIASFVFCEGPGSVLGMRSVAMALRTWGVLRPRPVFAYSRLALVAHALGLARSGIIADARRNAWHHYDLEHGLRRVATADLSGDLRMPENFRHWSPLPPGVTPVPYSLESLWPQVWKTDLLRPTDAPDAFLHEEPSYVTWSPQIHRAPP